MNAMLDKLRSPRIKKAQSFIELAILMPILLMMLSGLIEFGFLLNHYLDLLDGTREAARFVSDASPFIQGSNIEDPNTIFYTNAASMVKEVIAPLKLKSTTDDVVISVFGIGGGRVLNRFPQVSALTSIPGEWRLYGNHISEFSNADIRSRLVSNAPNTGLVLVEVFYDYDQVLKLPWITAFVPDPIQVHVYSIMPLVSAEPNPYP
jgi:hypothetical protein